MPIKFTDLARATKGATLDLGGGDIIHFEFRHGLITPRFMHRMLSLGSATTADEQAAAVMALAEDVAQIVVEWDVLDSDGAMFPLTVERLSRDIPWSLLIDVLQKCIAEMNPGEASAPEANDSAKKPSSGAGSSRKVASGRRRTGTR